MTRSGIPGSPTQKAQTFCNQIGLSWFPTTKAQTIHHKIWLSCSPTPKAQTFNHQIGLFLVPGDRVYPNWASLIFHYQKPKQFVPDGSSVKAQKSLPLGRAESGATGVCEKSSKPRYIDPAKSAALPKVIVKTRCFVIHKAEAKKNEFSHCGLLSNNKLLDDQRFGCAILRQTCWTNHFARVAVGGASEVWLIKLWCCFQPREGGSTPHAMQRATFRPLGPLSMLAVVHHPWRGARAPCK